MRTTLRQFLGLADAVDHPWSRGQTRLGPLVLFILLVVVVTISAGVLVTSTGLLEVSTGSTPDEQPTTPFEVGEKTGRVATDNATVETVSFSVRRSPDRGAFALANLTVEWFGPTGHTTLRYGEATTVDALGQPSTEFAVATGQDSDTSHPRLETTSNRFTIQIDAAALTGGHGLSAGTTVAVKITMPGGATQFVTLHTPDSLDTQTAVTL